MFSTTTNIKENHQKITLEDLFNTIEHSSIEAVEKKIKQYASQNSHNLSGILKGKSVTHLVIDSNPDLYLKYLIEAKFDLNTQDNNGDTPLHLAARKNRYDLCKLLITNGATLNIQNQTGNTPLHEAFLYPTHLSKTTEIKNDIGKYNIAKLLIANGASSEISNERGETPAMVAEILAERDIDAKLVLKVIENKKKISAENKNEKSALVANSFINDTNSSQGNTSLPTVESTHVEQTIRKRK